jgi:hypothetical protein
MAAKTVIVSSSRESLEIEIDVTILFHMKVLSAKLLTSFVDLCYS